MGKPNRNPRRHQPFQAAFSSRPSGTHAGESKISLVKQGVEGAFRAKNLRLLLKAVTSLEDLAMLAEVPLDRLVTMSEGALCTDGMAFHIEQQLELPSGWLDAANSTVPPEVIALLQNPPKRDEEDFYLTSVAAAPAPAAQTPMGGALAGLALIMSGGALPAQQVQAPLLLESRPETIYGAVDVDPPASAPAPVSTTPEALVEAAVVPASEVGTSNPPPLLSNEDPMTTMPNELRRANLNVLLAGKGAKSALARLINMSSATVTSMVNGTKQMDKDTCAWVAKAVHLPENWFEAERTADDVPAAVLKRLAPLMRNALVGAPAAGKQARGTKAENGTTSASNSTASAAPAAAAPTAAASPEARPQSWPAEGGSKVSRLRALNGEATPAQAAPAAPPAQASLPITEPARTPAPVGRGKSASARTGDVVPSAGSGFMLSEGLPPIAEALIKTLARKAMDGEFSEDDAFEMLASVRTRAKAA